MEKKNLIVQWLAHGEITSMDEYTKLLQKEKVEISCRTTIWALALTKSWYKRIKRPARSMYTIFLECNEKHLCLECFNNGVTAKDKDKQESPQPESKKEESKKEENSKEESKKEEDKKEKDSEQLKQSKQPEQPPSKIDNHEHKFYLTDEEIEEIIIHIDKEFIEKEDIKKTQEQRRYLIHISLAALVKTEDYLALVDNPSVSSESVDSILSLFVCTFSFLSSVDTTSMFKLMFLITSNINGVFMTAKGQSITREGFDKFLLLMQNAVAISRKKFILLIDVISTLNQEYLAKFIYDAATGSISLSKIKSSLFSEYSKKSVEEIEKAQMTAPGQVTRILCPEIVFTHTNASKSIEALIEENNRLRQNIETMFCDLRYFGSCKFISDLKQQILAKSSAEENKKK